MRLPVSDQGRRDFAVVRMQFLDASDSVVLDGSDHLPGKSAYFRGADPDKWVKDVPHYQTVTYSDIYPGIDVVFHGHEGELRYDFLIAPDTDPQQIRLGFSGIQDLVLSDNGDLLLRTAADEVVHRSPVIFQDIDGVRTVVDGTFEIIEENEVRFALASYDTTQPLVIDPVISYSTYLGGVGGDAGRSIRVDPIDSSIVVTGRVDSIDFPLLTPIQPGLGGNTPNGWSPNPNSTDALFTWETTIGRLDSFSVSTTTSTRTVLLSNPGWRTDNPIFINNTSTYTASVWAMSPDGGVGHIPAIQFFDASDTFLGTIGATGPSGFPAQPVNTWIQRSFVFTPSSFPAFATATHVRLLVVQDIEITMPNPTTVFFDDVSLVDNAVMQNQVQNPTFVFGIDDVFVSKFTADGSALIFSTYIGGSASEIPQNLELDSFGNIVVGGRTSSADFPTASAANATYSGPFEDGFLFKLPPDGSSLTFSTFVGAFDNFHPFEEVRGIAIDGSDNIYIIGNTGASTFSTTHIITSPCVVADVFRKADIFVRKYTPAGVITFSTCFGGTTRDSGRNIALDSSGNIYANGWTESIDFPTSAGAVQGAFGGGFTDGWVARLNGNATTILASTYLGGSGDEFLEGLGVDSVDDVVVSGASNSIDYPTTLGSFQPAFGGSAVPFGEGDGVVTKLDPTMTSFVFSTYLGGSGDEFTWGLKLDSEDRVYLTGFTTSTDYPVVDPIQSMLAGVQDVIVTQMTALGDALDFSTYLGGTGVDGASNGITVLNPGNVWVTGLTNSTDFPVVDPFQMANAGNADAFVTNISTPVTVPAVNCTFTALGCNPTGAQQIVLPEGFIPPPGSTITQTAMQVDDPGFVNGQCDGVTPKTLLNGAVPVPGHICGGEDGFILLITETTDIDIREGVVETAAMPEVFSPDALECENPIVGDRLAQDIGVWVTDNPMELFENEAIEVTFDCGTSRSRTRGLSVFILDGFFDFGLGPTPDADAVTQAFVDLLIDKTDGLIAGVNMAEPFLKKGDFVKLRVKAEDIKSRLKSGDNEGALLKTDIFLKFVDKAKFDTSVAFNNEGNLAMRASNIKFILEVKVIPFLQFEQ